MEKLNKKDKLNIIKEVTKALEKGENLIIKTDGLHLIQGDAISTMVNPAHIIETIKEDSPGGDLLVEAMINTIRKED